jgi:hypothetical protein
MNKIAMLGWGSLLWDESDEEFNALHPVHGHDCQVAYSLSKRATAEEAIADLCAREKTNTGNVGIAFSDGSRRQGCDASAIDPTSQWAKESSVDAVVWTDFAGSFGGVPKERCLDTAVDHVQRLPPEGKAKAAEYIWRAPEFIVTPLRAALQAEPWFKNPKAVQSDSVKT